jgi:hypothetical protein
MKNIAESIRQHPYRSGTAVTLAATVMALEITGYVLNPSEDIPQGSCVSPFAVSNTYMDAHTSTLLETYSGLFTTGVVARGTVAEGASGVQASFKHPDADAAEWEKNASGMLPISSIGKYAYKMAIGDGAVKFGIRVVASAGSPLCNQVPNTTYQHYGRTEYPAADGGLPWRNPVADVTNLFSGS